MMAPFQSVASSMTRGVRVRGMRIGLSVMMGWGGLWCEGSRANVDEDV